VAKVEGNIVYLRGSKHNRLPRSVSQTQFIKYVSVLAR